MYRWNANPFHWIPFVCIGQDSKVLFFSNQFSINQRCDLHVPVERKINVPNQKGTGLINHETPGRQVYNYLTFPVVHCTADFLDVHNINLTRVPWRLDQLPQKLAHALWESSFLGLTNLVQMRPHNDEACIGSCGRYGV